MDGEKKRRLFLLEVQGDSMKDEGILDGDKVIVRRQSQADSGQIVVAMIGEEASLKKFIPRAEGVELRSANPQYPPIFISPDSAFRILGVLGS